MSLTWNIKTVEGFCTIILAAIVVIVLCAFLVSVFGCNSDLIANLTGTKITTQDQIDQTKKDIADAEIRLEDLTLEDSQKVEFKAFIASSKQSLDSLNAKLVRLDKAIGKAGKEDDDMFGTLSQTANELTPLGYGGVVTSLMLLVKGFLKHRAFKNVVASTQPLVDDQSENTKQAIRNAQTPAAARLIDGMQGKTKIPILPI